MPEFFKYFQEKVVFAPSILPKSYSFEFEQDFEEYLWSTPYDGTINVIHFKINNPKGVILYFHGNSSNLQRWGKIAGSYIQFGYDVLVMDYRGYGKSSGPRNENNLYSDAQYFYDFAKNIYGENNLVVYGRSLGGAYAVKVAAENMPKAVILEATFLNLQDLVNRWLPNSVTNLISPTMTYHFLSNENIADIQVPLYHFHGNKDLIVPIKSGKKLFEVFQRAQPGIEKKFIEIDEGTHDDLVNHDLYTKHLEEILGSKMTDSNL